MNIIYYVHEHHHEFKFFLFATLKGILALLSMRLMHRYIMYLRRRKVKLVIIGSGTTPSTIFHTMASGLRNIELGKMRVVKSAISQSYELVLPAFDMIVHYACACTKVPPKVITSASHMLFASGDSEYTFKMESVAAEELFKALRCSHSKGKKLKLLVLSKTIGLSTIEKELIGDWLRENKDITCDITFKVTSCLSEYSIACSDLNYKHLNALIFNWIRSASGS